MHMYSSLMSGSSSHKKVSDDTNWFLRLYYESRLVLFLMCAGNELFFVMLYVIYHFEGPTLALGDGLPTVSLLLVITLLSFPVFAGKQVLSVIQMYGAAQALTEHDQQTRRSARATAAAGNGKGAAGGVKKGH
eukprot:Unigene5923_Nuclearia_a/m.18137 Unigene5923_Nuclearia_a/g.18137  ORF Unigene5923_Nuclearia_a/g.18137 Unigene5923_Nuclearia_a/m.18137 type:complete len:133 (-) Unigene5923_Nuclearia_a:66-464(-)